MSFFRRNKNEIPEVAPNNAGSNRGPPSYKSSASSYNASRDGPDPYARSNSFYSAPKSGGNSATNVDDPYANGDRYHRNQGVGDAYSRIGGGNVEDDRQALFSGYQPNPNATRNRFDDRGVPGSDRARWQDRTPQNQQEEEEDVETIKKDTRALKQDTAASSRNALRIAREAEETARNTLLRLGDQSEKIANVERHLDVAKANTNRAEDRTGELKQLNKSIFRPVITWDKEGKRRKEEARINERHAQERQDRENALMDVRQTQNRIGQAATYGQGQDEDHYGGDDGGSSAGYGRRNLTQQQQNTRMQARSRFQFQKSASDDELEDEIDDNVDEIHDVTKRLRALATAQGEELDNHNTRLTRISDNATKLDDKVHRATNRLKNVK